MDEMRNEEMDENWEIDKRHVSVINQEFFNEYMQNLRVSIELVLSAAATRAGTKLNEPFMKKTVTNGENDEFFKMAIQPDITPFLDFALISIDDTPKVIKELEQEPFFLEYIRFTANRILRLRDEQRAYVDLVLKYSDNKKAVNI